MSCKRVVPAVVCRNSHDCSCSVTGKYIFRNPDRNFLLCERICSIAAGKDTCNLTCLGHSLPLCLLFGIIEILLDSTLLLWSSQFFHPFTLRSEYHESDPEYSVSPGSKYLHVILLGPVGNLEYHLGSL